LRSNGTWELDVGTRHVSADVVVSTIPPEPLVTAADAPADVIAAARGLVTRGAILVYLVVPRARYTMFDAHYFPGRDVTIARLSEPKNYRDSLDDPADLTVLCAELPAAVGDDGWRTGDTELAAAVRDDLVRSGLPDPHPIAHHVVRMPGVYPVYDHGFAARQAVVEAWTAAQPRLVAVGRQALFAHDNTHHALAMGWAAADALGADGRIDSTRWDTARQTFRNHVVED
jgi:protoporphyrinogen oxidase